MRPHKNCVFGTCLDKVVVDVDGMTLYEHR